MESGYNMFEEKRVNPRRSDDAFRVKKSDIVCAFHMDTEKKVSHICEKIDKLETRINKLLILVILVAADSGVTLSDKLFEWLKGYF